MIAHLAIPKRSLWATLAKGIGEWFFALFLFAGYYKADPRLAFIQTHLDLTLLFLILSFLVFFHRLLRKPFAQKIPAGFIKVAALFLLLASCLLGGLLISQSTGYGLDKTLRFIVLTGWAFFGTAFLITDFQSLRRFSWAVVIIATVMAIDALLKYPGVGKVAFVSALGSNYIALARAGGFGLLTTLTFLLPTERGPLVRLSLWVMAALQFWAALSAGARGPVVALILAFLFFFALSARGFPRLRINRFALQLAVVMFVVVIIFAAVGQDLFSTLMFRSQILVTEVGTSVATRLDLYRTAIELWADSPIWGRGTGQFAVAVAGEDIRLYPHNIVLELGAETGIVGVLGFVTMIALAFTKGFICLHREKGVAKIVARYLLVAGCFALLNAMVSGDINDNRILFTLVGLLTATSRFSNDEAESGKRMSIERARAKDHRYLLHLRLIVTSLALLLCSTGILGLQGCRHSSNVKESTLETPSSHRVQAVYDGLLAATSFGRNILYSDNLTGRIVWNEAQFMESLINMYEVTRDRRYLEVFVEHADHVLQMRDDYARRLDYAGRLRPGWQAGAYYTLGVPVIIPDEWGYPSLEIQGIHRAGNNYTVVEITQEDHERFTLHIRNDFRRSKPLEVKFEGLTLKNVEGVVNANTSPDSWVRVRVVGTNPPTSGVWALQETYRMVIHELHTPIIGIPFLRFADLVFRSPELAIYQPKAEKYVQAFEESFLDYANSWREDAEGGFFIFEPGGKYWASGLPVPYNGLSANGRFLLWLYRVTGNTDYLEKAAAVAQKVRAGITFLPDGTMTMPYWVKDSLPYIGWENRGSDPVNGLYSRSDPDHATEDVSHFSLTLRFMVDAWQMGVVFQDDDLKAVARTFVERLWKPMNAKVKELCNSDWRKGFYLAHNLDGNSRAYDYAIATFALLSRWEPTILSRALEVYEARYKDADCIDIDYLYGEVMLGWSVLAVKGVPPVIGFRQKPLYPFTLRVSAEEYVKSSRLVSLDEHGIPVTDYGALHGGAGRRYNPTFIANYALALYRDYLVTGDPALLQAFQNQVQWFLDHRTQREYQGFEFWVWEFDFDNPLFGAKAPWVSALSQGRVLCVFLAAYDLMDDPEYLRAAEYVFRSFVVPASAGGVTTFEDNIAWYEEVADEEAPSAKILNGHIAAVQALWTFWQWTGRADVKRYLDLGIAAVREDIASYDAGFLSYYSQHPTKPRLYAPARDYNALHVHQLSWLYEVTGEPVFLEYALRFARYDTPGWEITTAGSTDPVGHGPDSLFFQMYSKYWSHNQFPTWVQLDLGKPQLIEGVVLFGYTIKSTPRDFQVFVSGDGGEWKLVLQKLGNEEQYFIERFEPLIARLVRIVILNDNGNNNVALTGVAVLRKHVVPIAVCDWASFSAGNLPALVFGQGWKIPEKGWIVMDLGSEASQDVVIELTGSAGHCAFTLSVSNELGVFDIITPPEVRAIEGGWQVELQDVRHRYLKIEFHEGCKGGKLLIRRLP